MNPDAKGDQISDESKGWMPQGAKDDSPESAQAEGKD